MLLRLLLLVAAGTLAGPAWSQTLTVDEAVRRGLEHSRTLEATRAEADAALAGFRQVRAERLPTVSSQASYMRLSDNIPEIVFSTDFLPGLDTSFTLAPVELNRYYGELAFEQPLFTGFRLHNEIEAARSEAEAAGFAAVQQEADVSFEIRQAYWRLHQALAARDAAEEALALVDAHLRDVQNQLDAGAALRSDVLSVQTRRSEVRLERVESENAVRLARLELNRLIGMPFDAVVSPDAEIVFEPLPGDLNALVERALDNRPALHALRARVDAFDARVDATQGAWLPQVALNGRYVYARPNQYFFTEQEAFRGTWEAGVAMRWNIWDGGSKLAETRRSRAQFDAAEARLAAATEAVTLEVARQYLEAQAATESIVAASQHVEETEEVLRVMRQQYVQGAALSADVLEAEQALRAARARVARSRADYAIARAALRNALGEVW
jgi:outer membrane protein TolC